MYLDVNLLESNGVTQSEENSPLAELFPPSI